MCKSCVNPVENDIKINQFFTVSPKHIKQLWVNLLVIPTKIHKFCAQFSTAKKAKITDIGVELYTFSTALIISPANYMNRFLI